VPRYLHLDLSKHVVRNNGRFWLRAHTLWTLWHNKAVYRVFAVIAKAFKMKSVFFVIARIPLSVLTVLRPKESFSLIDVGSALTAFVAFLFFFSPFFLFFFSFFSFLCSKPKVLTKAFYCGAPFFTVCLLLCNICWWFEHFLCLFYQVSNLSNFPNQPNSFCFLCHLSYYWCFNAYVVSFLLDVVWAGRQWILQYISRLFHFASLCIMVLYNVLHVRCNLFCE